jgi:hypothetical protein
MLKFYTRKNNNWEEYLKEIISYLRVIAINTAASATNSSTTTTTTTTV